MLGQKNGATILSGTPPDERYRNTAGLHPSPVHRALRLRATTVRPAEAWGVRSVIVRSDGGPESLAVIEVGELGSPTSGWDESSVWPATSLHNIPLHGDGFNVSITCIARPVATLIAVFIHPSECCSMASELPTR